MCEVQIIKKFSGTLTNDDIDQFFTMLEMGSHYNADAYGFFNDKNYMFRKAGAFKDEKPTVLGGLKTNILKKKPTLLVGHNRLTTQGTQGKNFNNHPFPTEDWIIVHNGILTNDAELKKEYRLEYKEETDSAVIVRLLQHFTDEGDDCVTALKRVAEELKGRFSVCAYNKTENRLFYFKNKDTSFGFRIFFLNNGSRVLVGSTSMDNFDSLYVWNYMIFPDPQFKKFFQTEAYDGIIYEITDEAISERKCFTPAITPTSYHYGSYASPSRTSSSESKNVVIKGGIYDEDWKDFEDWDGQKDIDYSTESDQVVVAQASVKEKYNVMRQEILNTINSIEENTGLKITPTIDYSKECVLLRVHDSPVGMQELCSNISQICGVRCQPYSHNELDLAFSEILG